MGYERTLDLHYQVLYSTCTVRVLILGTGQVYAVQHPSDGIPVGLKGVRSYGAYTAL